MSIARFLRIWHHRVRSLIRKDVVDAEVASELAFHFNLLVAEHVTSGMPLDEARRAARRALGNVAVLEEQCRDHRRVSWWHDLRQDVSYGLRVLAKNRAFTFVAALSLALGLGANAATLGVLHTLQGLAASSAGCQSPGRPAQLSAGQPGATERYPARRLHRVARAEPLVRGAWPVARGAGRPQRREGRTGRANRRASLRCGDGLALGCSPARRPRLHRRRPAPRDARIRHRHQPSAVDDALRGRPGRHRPAGSTESRARDRRRRDATGLRLSR